MAKYASNWRATIKTVPEHSSSSVYFEWNRDELEIRGFLIASNHAMREWFNAHASTAKREADDIRRSHSDPDIFDEGELYDLFVDLSDVDPHSYFWQLSSAAVKDACGLYEIYLERAADEVLRNFGVRLKALDTQKSWNWPTCSAFYDAYFNINVRPRPVNHIIWMRNKMAHLRDALRTEEGAFEFAKKLKDLAISGPETAEEQGLGLSTSPPAWSDGVRLSALETYRILNIIRSQVNQVTECLSAFACGKASTGYLDALKAGSPLGTGDLNPDKLLMRAQSPREPGD